MKWNLRLTAAERGIWKSSELRRKFADAGLEISSGKMSALWTQTPTTVRIEDLDVMCDVLECSPSDLLITEPEKVAARRPKQVESSSGVTPITPHLGRNRTLPPA